MKRLFTLTAALLLSASPVLATTTKQLWSPGWDNFSEPLNYNSSTVQWSVNAISRKLTVTYNLVRATPNKLYQVGAHIYCTKFPATFGQFPTHGAGSGNCFTMTRQGVTQSVVAVEAGVVTTDIHGNGSFTVIIGPIVSGTYELEFTVRNGAGCNLSGGGGNGGCGVNFQSPGPFGAKTPVTVP